LAFALFLLAIWGNTLTVRAQQTAAIAPPATEYTNIPVSTRVLRRGVNRAQLIVLGQIVEYAANKDGEDIVVVVTETYKGSVRPGERISVECVCHHEVAPAPASRVGHRVILFLEKKYATGPWSPASAPPDSPDYMDYMLFFHPEIRTRILHILGTHAVKQAKP
jgi:hypothetical protein